MRDRRMRQAPPRRPRGQQRNRPKRPNAGVSGPKRQKYGAMPSDLGRSGPDLEGADHPKWAGRAGGFAALRLCRVEAPGRWGPLLRRCRSSAARPLSGLGGLPCRPDSRVHIGARCGRCVAAHISGGRPVGLDLWTFWGGGGWAGVPLTSEHRTERRANPVVTL